MAIMDVLPCPTCKDNYKKNHMLELPLTDKILGSKDLLVKWLIDFHNLVNKTKWKKDNCHMKKYKTNMQICMVIILNTKFLGFI